MYSSVRLPLMSTVLAGFLVVGCGATSPSGTHAPPGASPAEIGGSPVVPSAPPPAMSSPMPATADPTAAASALPTASPRSEPPAARAQLTIEQFRYEPQRLTVARGTTVTWTNLDAARHTVTSGSSDSPDGQFDSGALAQDESFEVRFDQAGTFAFFCNLHPRMTGEIEVQP